MSDKRNKTFNKYSKLHVCLFPAKKSLIESLAELLLDNDCFKTTVLNSCEDLIDFVEREGEHIDCLILLREAAFNHTIERLTRLNIILPIVIIENTKDIGENGGNLGKLKFNYYHSAEVRLYPIQIEQINSFINLAISRFLHLTPSCSLSDRSIVSNNDRENDKSDRLLEQQRRLTEKLKERLGYLGVYYKRNSKNFYRHLSESEKETLLQKLVAEYSKIILSYFSNDSKVDRYIDEFVNRAFLADISVSQILEIHMEIVDELSQQLKAEGRNEEILLDYRLALIDTIANLCEMYRRSIPREDVALELLFGVE
ncbi:circadian clock protein KaiA [Myxosarcina sp. GI1]|uniref:circadian clock protein KaiA n=1 Tax=Myxosarcina sp. GI1 TaxID=1541065 RepID=UPI000569A2DE|nr:circadian clock protein KaiA [Myxosarcina sp. GI1]